MIATLDRRRYISTSFPRYAHGKVYIKYATKWGQVMYSWTFWTNPMFSNKINFHIQIIL